MLSSRFLPSCISVILYTYTDRFVLRYGRKPMLIADLICLSIWTLAIGFTSSFIQMTVFRGLQGMGAALTIPSAVRIISSYFTGQNGTRALGLYAASGAVGFTAGLVLGELLFSSLGWRYTFRLPAIVSALFAILGFLAFPSTSIKRDPKPEMGFLGASLSTAGLMLTRVCVIRWWYLYLDKGIYHCPPRIVCYSTYHIRAL